MDADAGRALQLATLSGQLLLLVLVAPTERARATLVPGWGPRLVLPRSYRPRRFRHHRRRSSVTCSLAAAGGPFAR